jgi:hypothetical protein
MFASVATKRAAPDDAVAKSLVETLPVLENPRILAISSSFGGEVDVEMAP